MLIREFLSAPAFVWAGLWDLGTSELLSLSVKVANKTQTWAIPKRTQAPTRLGQPLRILVEHTVFRTLGWTPSPESSGERGASLSAYGSGSNQISGQAVRKGMGDANLGKLAEKLQGAGKIDDFVLSGTAH